MCGMTAGPLALLFYLLELPESGDNALFIRTTANVNPFGSGTSTRSPAAYPHAV
jgi:hypothetical protein